MSTAMMISSKSSKWVSMKRSSHERLEFAPVGTEITPLNPAAMEEAASNSPSWMMQEVCPIRESML